MQIVQILSPYLALTLSALNPDECYLPCFLCQDRVLSVFVASLDIFQYG
jgi:hypothetical protein